MADELLPYYEKELTYLKQLGAKFSVEHPKIAGHLGISTDSVEDPHVSRLIESVAFLNARLQHRLDDGYAELANDLLEVLYPHFLRPIPPFTIARFTVDPELIEEPFLIARHTEFDSAFFSSSTLESAGGLDQEFESCRFRTSEDLLLLPIEVHDAQIFGRPFNTPGASSVRQAESVVKLSLKTLHQDIKFSDLDIDRLKLYLPGNNQYAHKLYQFLVRDCVSLVIKDPDSDAYPQFVSKDAIEIGGFSHNEALLPYSASTFEGYRALTEFFCFPEKFSFVTLIELDTVLKDSHGRCLDFYFYISESDIDLEHQLSKDSFAINCCPLVNLFAQRGDPLKIKRHNEEIELQPDARRPRSLEVYSIDSVAVSSENKSEEYQPLYGARQMTRAASDSRGHYYKMSRRAAKLGYGTRDEGSDVSLTLFTEEGELNFPEDASLHTQLICFNRDLVSKLPFNAEQPVLQASNVSIPCSTVQCIVQPTRALRDAHSKQSSWNFVSHLAVNHLSISGGEDGAAALKDILSLYDFKRSSINRGIIDSIQSVRSKNVSAPITIDGRIVVCQGSQIEVILDKEKLTGSSAFLFAKTLEYFFSVYASINSFTRTVVRFRNVEKALFSGKPRAGARLLV